MTAGISSFDLTPPPARMTAQGRSNRYFRFGEPGLPCGSAAAEARDKPTPSAVADPMGGVGGFTKAAGVMSVPTSAARAGRCRHLPSDHP